MTRLLPLLAPILFYLVIHAALLWSIDLRDMPGAAGTETIYKASVGERKGDITVMAIQWIAHYIDVGPQKASRLLSSLCGLVQLLSLMLCGAAHTRKTAIIAGWIGSCWSMSHYFSLMSGSDPLSIALAWLSIGLCWWGISISSTIGIFAVMLGISMAPLAVSIKELALPPIALLFLIPIWIRYWNQKVLFAIPIIGYCAYWSYAWMWPSNATRIQTTGSLSITMIYSGWERLLDLYPRGLPQGKYDQLLILSGALLCTSRKKLGKRVLLWSISALILVCTAYFLGPRTRPRYITPATLGILISIACSISLWKHNISRFVTIVMCSLLLCDSWAYYDSWSQKRTYIVGGIPDKIPTSPSWWTQQYQQANDITHRDLSLYGAIDLIDILSHHAGLATMRLRDERHRSLLAFAEISGKKALVLDPGACCSGEPVDKKCAHRVVQALIDAGYGIVIPTQKKGVERIYPNEERWRSLLLQSHDSWIQSTFWYDTSISVSAPTSSLPCQQKAPFRNPK